MIFVKDIPDNLILLKELFIKMDIKVNLKKIISYNNDFDADSLISLLENFNISYKLSENIVSLPCVLSDKGNCKIVIEDKEGYIMI